VVPQPTAGASPLVFKKNLLFTNDLLKLARLQIFTNKTYEFTVWKGMSLQ
jgi:hypothetical protein